MEETFAGIDWASEEHALCVVDGGGATLEGEMHAHDEAGIKELVARMRALGVGRVAIERPDGLRTASWRPASPSCRSTPTS